ncbi:MAG: FixH family protein, partial [Arenimonas sp.]
VTDLAPDRNAATRGLRASLRVDTHGMPRLSLPPGNASTALDLRFVHPTRAGDDLRWTREAGATQWRGPPLPAQARGRWVLEDRAHAWRLVGQWTQESLRVDLQPSVVSQ